MMVYFNECKASPKWNFSSVDDIPDTTFYFEWEHLMYAILLPFVFLFAGISNSLFLIVVARVQFMRTTTNVYLANLAVSDMCYILGTTVFFCVRYYASEIRHDCPMTVAMGCYTVYFLLGAFFYTSMIMVSLVSLERYLAICHPLRHLKIKSKGRTAKIIIVGWVLGILSSIMTSLFYLDWNTICAIWPVELKDKRYPNTFNICRFGDDSATYLSVVIITSAVWISTSICNGFFYANLLISVRNVDPDLALTNANKNKNQITLILVINGIIFIACTTMYFISFIIVAVGKNNPNTSFQLTPLQEVVWFWMMYLVTFVNSSVHSVVYSIASQQYRKAFIITLTCQSVRTCQSIRRDTPTTTI